MDMISHESSIGEQTLAIGTASNLIREDICNEEMKSRLMQRNKQKRTKVREKTIH